MFRRRPNAEVGTMRNPVTLIGDSELARAARVAGRETAEILLLASKGYLSAAIWHARRLLDHASDLIDVRGHLAYWLELEGRMDEAREQYALVAAQDPANERARVKLAELGALRQRFVA